MMLIGRIAKEQGPFWSAECETVGAFTQGTSRANAARMLADCIEAKIGRKDLEVNVKEAGPETERADAFVVLIEANVPALLAAAVLRYQREVHKLSLREVAAALGTSNVNAYAAYEQGKREPSLSKFIELLAAVAPDMALTVGPRSISPATKRDAAR